MSLVTRAMNILQSPKTEWDVIAGESATTSGLITGYALPWLLLSHISGFIGSAFISGIVASVTGIRFGMMYWLGSAVIGFVLSIVGLYIGAFVINALAPSFKSVQNNLNAMKLIVYGSTAMWVAGLAAIIPFLGGLIMIAGAIYAVYIFYLGVPKLMGTPQEKVIGYMVVSAIVLIIIQAVIGAVTGSIAGLLFVTSTVTNY